MFYFDRDCTPHNLVSTQGLRAAQTVASDRSDHPLSRRVGVGVSPRTFAPLIAARP